MEEECDSRNQSEDDSSPTDTSEDSVDVKVSRIYLPGSYPRKGTIPIDLRKSNSSSYNIFEPLDFSVHQLTSTNRHSHVGPSNLDVEEKLPLCQNSGSSDFKDRKSSRRKASDPRRLLLNEGKRTKRCVDTEPETGPPSKQSRQEVKYEYSSAESSSSLNTNNNHATADTSTFQPLILSALHPMMRYPYSHVNNIMIPNLDFLTQGLHHMTYPIIPDISPCIRTIPTNEPREQIKTSPTSELVSQNTYSKKSDTVKVLTAVPKEKKQKQIGKEPKSHRNQIANINLESPNKQPQDSPIDYSFRKLSCSRDIKHIPSSPTENRNIFPEAYGEKHKQRNYKNMTRERRIEANARERTRVHTISAAFDKLRQSVPSYSNNQKLSKLSVIRIACTYILSLSRLADLDYSLDNTNPSFAECVDLTTKTIQIEGNTKKRKDG